MRDAHFKDRLAFDAVNFPFEMGRGDSDRQTTVTVVPQQAMDELLARPEGLWTALCLLFPHLLRDRVGLPAAQEHSPGGAGAFYGPAHDLLRAWGTGNPTTTKGEPTEHCVTALGLALALHRLAPQRRKRGARDSIDVQTKELPRFFDPAQAGQQLRAGIPDETARLLSGVDAAVAELRVREVSLIAAEVASVLTDAPARLFDSESLGRWVRACDDRQKLFAPAPASACRVARSTRARGDSSHPANASRSASFRAARCGRAQSAGRPLIAAQRHRSSHCGWTWPWG